MLLAGSCDHRTKRQVERAKPSHKPILWFFRKASVHWSSCSTLITYHLSFVHVDYTQICKADNSKQIFVDPNVYINSWDQQASQWRSQMKIERTTSWCSPGKWGNKQLASRPCFLMCVCYDSTQCDVNKEFCNSGCLSKRKTEKVSRYNFKCSNFSPLMRPPAHQRW